MTRPRRTEDVVYALIRQALDDANLHLCAADAMVRGGSVMEAIRRIERAASSYEEAGAEFTCQRETMGHRRRSDVSGDLNAVCRRLWIAVADVSRIAKTSAVAYNQLRGLRRGFLIFGGLADANARAAGA